MSLVGNMSDIFHVSIITKVSNVGNVSDVDIVSDVGKVPDVLCIWSWTKPRRVRGSRIIQFQK